MTVQSKPKHVGAIDIYFNVNFNVLKQNYCALVGVIKDWTDLSSHYVVLHEKNTQKCFNIHYRLYYNLCLMLCPIIL